MSIKTIDIKSTWATDPKGSWPGIKAEVVATTVANGVAYVTYIRTSKGWDGKDVQEVRTLTENGFRKSFIQDDTTFFQVGGTYKYKWGDATYHVQELYRVSKAADHNKRAARAIAINKYDERQMIMLNVNDFEDMVKVK